MVALRESQTTVIEDLSLVIDSYAGLLADISEAPEFAVVMPEFLLGLAATPRWGKALPYDYVKADQQLVRVKRGTIEKRPLFPKTSPHFSESVLDHTLGMYYMWEDWRENCPAVERIFDAKVMTGLIFLHDGDEVGSRGDLCASSWRAKNPDLARDWKHRGHEELLEIIRSSDLSAQWKERLISLAEIYEERQQLIENQEWHVPYLLEACLNKFIDSLQGNQMGLDEVFSYNRPVTPPMQEHLRNSQRKLIEIFKILEHMIRVNHIRRKAKFSQAQPGDWLTVEAFLRQRMEDQLEAFERLIHNV